MTTSHTQQLPSGDLSNLPVMTSQRQMHIVRETSPNPMMMSQIQKSRAMEASQVPMMTQQRQTYRVRDTSHAPMMTSQRQKHEARDTSQVPMMTSLREKPKSRDMSHTRMMTSHVKLPTSVDTRTRPSGDDIQLTTGLVNTTSTGDMLFKRQLQQGLQEESYAEEPQTHMTLRSAANRKLTYRGQQYELDVKQKHMRALFRKLNIMSDEVGQSIDSGATVREVQSLFAQWLYMYEILLDTYEELCIVVTDPDLFHTAKLQFDKNHEPLMVFREDTKVRLLSHCSSVTVRSKGKSKSIKSESDTDSYVSRSVKSKCSSLYSSLFTAKVQEEQRHAELAARAESLKRKPELEISKLQLQQREEELELHTELAVSSAKSKVLEQFEEDQISRISDPESITRKTDRCAVIPLKPKIDFDIHGPVETELYSRNVETMIGRNNTDLKTPAASLLLPKLNFDGQIHEISRKPASELSFDSSHSSNHEMSQLIRQLKKPQCDITKFSGDPLRYRKFLRQFEMRILANTDDDDERVNYLELYTVGEANRIVQSLSHLPAKEAYAAVRREFEDRYGDTEIIAASFVSKALQWPVIRPNDVKALNDCSIFLSECFYAVSSLDSLKILEYPDNLRKLVCKLPIFMHHQWRNIVFKCKENSTSAGFKVLAEFVLAESKKASHPVFGKEALSSDIVEKKVRPRSSFAGVANPEETTAEVVENEETQPMTKTVSFVKVQGDYKSPAFTSPCIHCDKGHFLDSCESVPKLQFSERLQVLRSVV